MLNNEEEIKENNINLNEIKIEENKNENEIENKKQIENENEKEIENENENKIIKVKRGSIDLSLGLQAITPDIKVKRGSIDLSLGLEMENNHSNHNNKQNLPPSILKYGLERQISNELNENYNENINLSSELLSLLQTDNQSEEAWEVKADHDHKIPHTADEVIDAADILSKLGFSEGVNVESENWETKTPTDNNHNNNDNNNNFDNDNIPLDETKVLGLLGITNDQDAGEAWEKKTHKDDIVI